MKLASLWTQVPGGIVHSRANVGCPRPQRNSVVVLVHGLVISSRYMVPTAEQFAPLCRVYAVDLPGYGKSYKPSDVLTLPELADAIARWMDAMTISTAHLVANSFGCQILAEFALRHPHRIDRLVFQGPTVDPRARTVWRQLGRLLLNSAREAPGLGWITMKDYLAAGLRRVRGTIVMALADRIEDKLPKVTAPTLVVRGEKDPLVPQRWAEEVTRLLPYGELRILPGKAHTINYTAPREFVEVMRPFLNL
ncbi:MAG: alpha/beta fold hydrolase [Nitrospiraceae bacterium]